MAIDPQPRGINLPQQLLGMVALAIALFLAGDAIGDGMQSQSQRDTIVVTGSSRRPVEADRVSWSVSLSSHQQTAQLAVEELGRWTDVVRTFMRDGKISDEDLTVTPVSLSKATKLDADENEVPDGYSASRSLRIESDQMDVVAAVADKSDRLILDGIPIDTTAPDYVYTKLASNRAQMVAAAGKDAKARAQALVKIGGGRIGRIRKVSVGNFQVTTRGGTDFESGGSFDRGSRHKDIVVVVHLTFELK